MVDGQQRRPSNGELARTAVRPSVPPQFTAHWTNLLADNTRYLTVQLLGTGGSSALAMTATAPLERIKA